MFGNCNRIDLCVKLTGRKNNDTAKREKKIWKRYFVTDREYSIFGRDQLMIEYWRSPDEVKLVAKKRLYEEIPYNECWQKKDILKITLKVLDKLSSALFYLKTELDVPQNLWGFFSPFPFSSDSIALQHDCGLFFSSATTIFAESVRLSCVCLCNVVNIVKIVIFRYCLVRHRRAERPQQLLTDSQH